jgi:hypothetical protein
MAFSCTDFTDDVLNNLTELGLIRAADVEEDDPQAQANLVRAAINGLVVKAAGSQEIEALQFFNELLASVETLGGVADLYGTGALVQMYLQGAILKGTYIDLDLKEVTALSFVRDLPSGERWWKFVYVNEE